MYTTLYRIIRAQLAVPKTGIREGGSKDISSLSGLNRLTRDTQVLFGRIPLFGSSFVGW